MKFPSLRRLSACCALLAFCVHSAVALSNPPADSTAKPPADPPIRVELGRRLFYDADLSINGVMACASCHEQRRGFADGNRVHPGALDDAGKRHVPGLQNVARLHPLTWASRTAELERQALIPLFGEHPVEMAMKGQDAELLRRLAANPCYVKLFAAAFPQDKGAMSVDAVTAALASFERSLISFDSAFDKAERGEAPLAPDAAAGAALFFGAAGCARCHPAPDFTDGAFHALEPPDPADFGLAEESRQPGDLGLFRTPSLRNVALRGPMLHDGRARDLDEALARHHLAFAPAAADTARISAFLDALSDRSFIADPRFALPEPACPL